VPLVSLVLTATNHDVIKNSKNEFVHTAENVLEYHKRKGQCYWDTSIF
jgi:hypothetical protein